MIRTTSIPDFVRSLPEADLPFEGVKGWVLQGGAQQVVFLEFTQDVEVPEHSHREQWEFALRGSVTLRMNGEETRFGPGESFFIPAGVPHAASVEAGYQAMIVFNEPERYRTKA
jgi:quercetin dioxygenase-like cupin family protein